MSDEEEDSMSEGFSASEDEWMPTKKDTRGGESSDDDDSDFEDPPNSTGRSSAGIKSREIKGRSAGPKQTISKKRKAFGQSLRSKLYNKYRPPPKTLTSPTLTSSPSASTSRTASKNVKKPNECDDDNDSSSDSSVDDYLVNPDELDLKSSFFDIESANKRKSSPAPFFDCNAGITKLSDSGSEDNNESSAEEANKSKAKPFDFRKLLENANSLERAKETIAKRAAENIENNTKNSTAASLDVNSLLALGEKQNQLSEQELPAQKLNKTKSTRLKKRQPKTRPTSTVSIAGATAADSDDSDWEEVADEDGEKSTNAANTLASLEGDLEIHVDLSNKKRVKQQDLEMVLKRKLNRNLKDRQLLLHKASLLCNFARNYVYNRYLNDTQLMNAAVKLLPTKNAYPPESGTEIKYFQSFVTWFKTVIKLTNQNLYADKTAKTHKLIKQELLKQIQGKSARCKQDMILIFIILVRGMGLQCRLVANLQPLPLKPAASDLLSLKVKKDDKNDDSKTKSNVSKSNTTKESSNTDSSFTKQNVATNSKQKTNASKESKAKQAEHKKIAAKTQKKKPKDESGYEDSVDEQTKEQIKNKVEAATSSTNRNSRSKLRNAVTHSSRDTAEKKSTTKTKKENVTDQLNVQTSDTSIKAEASTSMDAACEKVLSASDKLQVNKRSRQTKTLKKEPASRDASYEDKKTIRTNSKKKPLKTEANSFKKEVISRDASFEDTNENASIVDDMNELQTKNSQLIYDSENSKHKLEMSAQYSKDSCLELTDYKNSSAEAQSTLDVPKGRATQRNTRRAEKCSSRESSFADDAQKTTSSTPKATRQPTRLKRKEVEVVFDSKKLKKNEEKSNSKNQNISTNSNTKLPIITIEQLSTPSSTAKSNCAESISPTSQLENVEPNKHKPQRTRSRSVSPRVHISPSFLQSQSYKEKFSPEPLNQAKGKPSKKSNNKNKNAIKISTQFLNPKSNTSEPENPKRVLRSKQKNEQPLKLSQLDGADDMPKSSKTQRNKPKLKKLNKSRSQEESDEDFEPSPPKKPKQAPALPKSVQNLRKDRRVLSTDNEENTKVESGKGAKRNPLAADLWIEVWCDVEEQWVCVDLFKGKIHSVESIRKSASNNLTYIFAYQNDLSVKDVTARYCPNWTSVHKQRVEKCWLDDAISAYLGHRTKRDILEDQELRRIHEEKPLPTSISDFKNHPLYALERHLLKFEGIYPPNAPTLGFIRGEPIYARDCVHTMHSREIWLKEARTVKLGEQAYKIVKARPKWDRITQTVIKDQPLEIFGYWQTEDYDPPTAENGIVPRNAYGNVELFKARMLPKKTVHLRLPGLNRVCKKLGVDCANAVIGFDFHQGSCHPTYDGFIVCEEFAETVTAAWEQEQEDLERKEQQKYEDRVYGNWKKLIRGLMIRERLKKKYNF